MAFTPTISFALHDTVTKYPKIANIFFTADGKYYFNAFNVVEKHTDGSLHNVLYARTKDVTNPIMGQTIGNTKTVGIPHTSIVGTLTRADLLALPHDPPIPPFTY